MTAQADAGSDPSLDWLPEPAVQVGRALRPVLQAYGRDDPVAELARQAGGFATEPPTVAVAAVGAAYGLSPSVRECSADELATLSTPYVAVVDGVPMGVTSN